MSHANIRFRNASVADSVVERITAMADHILSGTPMPSARGSAVVSLDRSESGELMVTKTFDNGETELLTISNQQQSSMQPPEGVVQIGGDEAPPPEQQLEAGGEAAGIASAAALGGDSLDALLRT